MEQTKILLDVSKVNDDVRAEVHVEGKSSEIIPLLCSTMVKSPKLYDVLKEAVEVYEKASLFKENPLAFLEKLMKKQ